MKTTISKALNMMQYEQVWVYVGELRRKRKVSQDKLADAVGVTREGWRLIESGITEDPKTSILLNAIRFLGGSFEDVQELAGRDATKERALELAQHRAEYVAAYGIAARRNTASQQEIDDQLRAIADAVTQTSMAIPMLDLLLRRGAKER